MTKDEARAKISTEFMNAYNQWMVDRFELNDHDYGWKYGWQKSERLMSLKDNLTAVTFCQKYIWTGRRISQWEKAGFDRRVLWDLVNDGFLSEQVYWSRGKENFIYISQRTAKQIYKEYKEMQKCNK